MGLFNWKKKKQEAQTTEAAPEKKGKGTFVSFVLLEENSYDLKALAARLKEDWNIILDEADVDDEKGVIAAEVEGMMVAVSVMGAPVPHEEVIANARTNYAWKEAVSVAEKHQDHVMVAVLGRDKPLLDAGKLLVKLLSSAAKGEHVTGLNTLGSVLHPLAYSEMAEMAVKADQYPVMNLIFVDLYSRDEGETYSGYTYGMEVFGKDDIEVIDSTQGREQLYSFLYDIAGYVILYDAILKDGETIGFTAEQKLQITYSDGVALGEKTIKIAY